MKGTKLSVADDPETQRIKKNTDNQSGVKYHNLAGQREQENVRREQEAENLVGTNRQGEFKADCVQIVFALLSLNVLLFVVVPV